MVLSPSHNEMTLEERGETHLVLAVAVATSWTAGHDRSVVCLAHFLRTCGCWEVGGVVVWRK